MRISEHIIWGGAFQNSDFGDASYNDLRIHNLFYYGLFRMVPVLMKNDFYDQGSWRSVEGMKKSYILGDYKAYYPVLENLSHLSRVSEGKGTFLMMANNATHADNTVRLQLPDYTPQVDVDNTGYNLKERFDDDGNRLELDYPYDNYINGDRILHYCVNASVMLRLGEWFEWLQQNDIYDNTRIIIVSDHGTDLALFSEVNQVDVSRVNAFLMVKEFNATGKMKTSHEFMTNADTPFLATRDLFAPVNPFTGTHISCEEKNGPQMITMSRNWMTDAEGYTFDTSDDVWFTVHDNIFENENWEEISYVD